MCGWYCCYYPYPLDEETEAWRVKLAEKHSELWESWNSTPRQPGFKVQVLNNCSVVSGQSFKKCDL